MFHQALDQTRHGALADPAIQRQLLEFPGTPDPDDPENGEGRKRQVVLAQHLAFDVGSKARRHAENIRQGCHGVLVDIHFFQLTVGIDFRG